jgi:hypothetical protein
MSYRLGETPAMTSGTRLVVGAVLLAALAGCDVRQPAHPLEPVTTVRETRRSAATDLSTQAAALAADTGPVRVEQVRLERAERELTRRCRAARGLPLPASSARTVLRLVDGTEVEVETGGCRARSRVALYGDVWAAAQVSFVPQTARHAAALPPAPRQELNETAVLRARALSRAAAVLPGTGRHRR